ncbi:hypothetical protein [Croceimicrobium hydrocarbonivorans]|uniref:Toprim domain-containing protein n=1 Tax=Croceimicrobium hydrocarbonivorans TaxID=2761580 RepID=A0A7H0VB41_9FLAO|nr:hypothetical protein [Croceimicrobium hydrocarbonivorans]QNR22939.1 hypothetical protein H4K34_11175 [Croceimicrobium hydrocarbonivorans]
MYIDQQEIFAKTNGGLQIILDYYKNAQDALDKKGQKFKIRDSEKTASASLKQTSDGNWIVTDFGGDGEHRNGIQVCMLEEGIEEYRTALLFLARKYGVKGEDGKSLGFDRGYEKLPIEDGMEENQYLYKIKDFTDNELLVLGPGVTRELCRNHHLYSLESYTYVSKDKKTGELVQHIWKSTDHYPVFQFNFESGQNEWNKRLEPKALKKSERFRYNGQRPNGYIMGLHLAQQRFDKLNADVSEVEYDSMDEMEKAESRQDKKLPEIIICGGDRDALATEAATGCTVVWFNSETAKITFKDMKKLQQLAYKVYYLGDIDSTGLKVQHSLGMQHLDLHLIRLPMDLLKKKDHRGNPCKDVREYLNYYKAYDLKKLIEVAVPYRMWDVRLVKHPTIEKMWIRKYEVNNLQLYNFLEGNGFYRFKLPNVKTGYIYIRVQNGVVEEIDHVEIKAFINQFLEGNKAEPALRNAFYRSRQHLGEQSLSNLRLKNIDFKDYTEKTINVFQKPCMENYQG